MAMIVIGASADQISIDDTRCIDKNTAADFQVKAALGHSRHSAALHAVGIGRYFDAVANTANRLIPFKEVLGNPQQVLVVTQVFRGSAAAEVDPQVVAGINIDKGDLGLNRVAFPLTS